ncbi:MAG: ribose-5-phosphate isomerase RpiA [Pseudomonadota bacterium]
MENQDLLKQRAAQSAVQFVESGMVLGLGTGSTTRFALEFIGKGIREGKLRDILGVPSSKQTENQAGEYGIPLTTLEKHSKIDLTIDGADEVDQDLNLIKGGGGALFREKVIAQASRRNIIIVDEGKVSSRLGTLWVIPVEVVPFAWKPVADFITSLGAEVLLREKGTGTPFITDQDNYVLDCNFGPIENPERIAAELEKRAGILEHGLFLNLATDVLAAGKEGIRHMRR